LKKTANYLSELNKENVMQKYIVRVYEVHSYDIEVEANDSEEARENEPSPTLRAETWERL
jgi:hypothetical protein